MNLTSEMVTKRERRFYPESLDVSKWENVEPCLNELLSWEIKSAEDLIYFIEKHSELIMLISEEEGKRYVKMSCYADNEQYKADYNQYLRSVVAKTKSINNRIDSKFYENSQRKLLDEKTYQHLASIIKNRIETFRSDNVSLIIEEEELSGKYSKIISQLTVNYDGKEQTLAQLSKYLQNNNREIRERVWYLRFERLLQEKKDLNNLFDELRIVREQQAEKVGFSNYRDYKHKAMGRFSYTPKDVEQFHRSVENVVIPYLKEKTRNRRDKLGIESVRPWDTAVDIDGKQLIPYSTIEELTDKGIKVLSQINPQYGINFNKMKNSSLLDLENRKGKSPGGFNYPLRELGSSFIMMNAVGTHRDIVTMIHEAGHAMHSFATRPLNLMDYKECPHECAELASMAMEMLSMDYWDVFYDSKTDLNKAKKDQLLKTVQFLPWCMLVDAFQQWIYTNPNHTPEEREQYYESLVDRFNTGINWDNLEDQKRISWMLQLHIFKYPFYYIEYGIAQLGALAIYKNYREKGKEALKQYDAFLKEGYTKPLDELYRTAGIKFDFSENYISTLIDFVRKESEEA